MSSPGEVAHATAKRRLMCLATWGTQQPRVALHSMVGRNGWRGRWPCYGWGRPRDGSRKDSTCGRRSWEHRLCDALAPVVVSLVVVHDFLVVFCHVFISLCSFVRVFLVLVRVRLFSLYLRFDCSIFCQVFRIIFLGVFFLYLVSTSCSTGRCSDFSESRVGFLRDFCHDFQPRVSFVPSCVIVRPQTPSDIHVFGRFHGFGVRCCSRNPRDALFFFDFRRLVFCLVSGVFR